MRKPTLLWSHDVSLDGDVLCAWTPVNRRSDSHLAVLAMVATAECQVWRDGWIEVVNYNDGPGTCCASMIETHDMLDTSRRRVWKARMRKCTLGL